jgi:hypothetical protein
MREKRLEQKTNIQMSEKAREEAYSRVSENGGVVLLLVLTRTIIVGEQE